MALVGSQRRALTEAEGGHRTFLSGGDWAAFADDAEQFRVGDDREEDRGVEQWCWSELAIGPVAAGAVRPLQDAEIRDPFGRHLAVGGPRAAG